jgi:predicted ATP-dependent serine protease
VEIERFLCANCTAPRPFVEERCGACGARSSVYAAGVDIVTPRHAAEADELSRAAVKKIPTGMDGVDGALEGGMVLGATVLLYGPGGSRKTTIAGAIAHAVGSHARRLALYVSSEQPSAQARDAAERIVGRAGAVAFLGTDRDSQNFGHVRAEVERLRPSCVVYDSIQEFAVPLVAVVGWGKRAAASMGHAAIFISTVNSAGRPEGPRRTIHRADTELELGAEGAWIRCHKSRYGVIGRAELDWSAPLVSRTGKAGKPKSARDGPKCSRM